MKTHKFDGVSFFSGLFIAAIGLLYLIPNTLATSSTPSLGSEDGSGPFCSLQSEWQC